MAQKNYPQGYPVQRIVGAGQVHPTSSVAYPTQAPPGIYPTQPYRQPGHYPQQPQYPHQPQQYPMVNPQAPYGYGQPPPPYPGAVVNPGIPQQLMVQGQFDSGARFGAGASMNIPPPPPGVMPTSGQMAAANGQSVVMHQPRAGWIEGSRGGGYTFW